MNEDKCSAGLQECPYKGDHDVIIRVDSKLDFLVSKINGFPEELLVLKQNFSNFKEDHLKLHESEKTDKRFSWQNILAVVAIVVSVAALVLKI